ncbi:MAG: hypothetical protein CMJ81_19650 [Planctomycetaceae bacterium]|nr:hypothetical protein [Planctomycetaceae bacterium]
MEVVLRTASDLPIFLMRCILIHVHRFNTSESIRYQARIGRQIAKRGRWLILCCVRLATAEPWECKIFLAIKRHDLICASSTADPPDNQE